MKNFLKSYDSTLTRWGLYVSLAFLTSMYNGFSKFNSFDDFNGFFAVQTFIFSIIQALVAWRAFIDQSISRDTAKQLTTLPPTSGQP